MFRTYGPLTPGNIFVSSDLTENVETVPRGAPSFTVMAGTSAQRVLGATLKFPSLSSGGEASTATASGSGSTVTAGLDVARPPGVVCAREMLAATIEQAIEQ